MSLLSRPTATTAALVLRAWPCGETSAIASLLTGDHGFVKVLAKAARRPRSRLRPLVEPGRLVEVEFTVDETRELQYLRGGSVLLDPMGAAPSLVRSAYLLAALELMDRCRPAAGAPGGGGGLFEVCEDFVRVLSSPTCGHPALLFFHLEWQLLDRHGLAPQPATCACCGREAAVADAGTLWFDPAEGGVVCGPCALDGPGAGRRSLSREAWEALGALAAPDTTLLASIDPTASLRREVGGHLHRFLGYHLPGYRLPTALDLLRVGKDESR